MSKPIVITVATNKGGAGKTTTAIHVAAWLALQGHRVLLADLDKQGQCATFLGLAPAARVYDLLVREVIPLPDLLVEARPNLLLLASNPETVIAQDFARLRNAGADLLEKRIVEQAAGTDYVVFDTPPQGLLQECAIYSADVLVVPVPVDYAGMDGASQFVRVAEHFPRPPGRHAHLLPLPMFVDYRTVESRMNLEELQRRFGSALLPPVPMRVRMRETVAEGKTIFEYAPREDVVEIYTQICTRILEIAHAPA